MKKINHYEGDCFEFHKEVLKRKESDDLKRDISSMADQIKKQYDNYDRSFVDDSLSALDALILDKAMKDKLKSLYSYDAYMFRKLRRILTVDINSRPNVLCPNCTINTINSFDHYLPQSEFAEYVDNPKNLIPSCTECNGHKSSAWRKDGKRLFLNLYIDDLPQEQYLFATLTIADDEKSVDVKFEVKNQEGKLDVDLYAKIFYHYDKLELCKRFSDHREKVLSSLANEIYTLKDSLSDELIKSVIRSSVVNDRERYGYNYWVAVMKEAVCDNQTVFDFFKKKPY